MKTRRFTRIFAAFLLAFAMLAGVAALAADNTAKTITLEKTEGSDVTVLSKSGKSLTITKSMKLFTGYTLKTGLKSYAYINLDSSKAGKLDASSEAEVRQSGKKLEVNVKTGKMSFNVSEKLKEDESLNIRTSTMVAGIRGTAGWVEVVDEKTSKLYLLTGEVIIICTDPNTNETTYEIIRAGEVGTGYINDKTPDADVEAQIEVLDFLEDDIPGFIAIEILNDEELQDRLREDNLLDVDRILENARKQLEADQAAAAAKQALIDGVIAGRDDNTNSVWADSGTATASGGGSNNSSTTTTLTGNITEVEVNNALASYTEVILDSGATVTMSTSSIITIEPGKTLRNQGTIQGTGVIQNNSNSSLYTELGSNIAVGVNLINGTSGASGLSGRMELAGTINGEVNNEKGTLTINGTVGATGGVVVHGGTTTIASGATINGFIKNFNPTPSEILTVASGAEANGNVDNVEGTMIINGDIGAVASPNPFYVAGGTVTLNGTANSNVKVLEGELILSNTGTINSPSPIVVGDSLSSYTGSSTFTINGTVNVVTTAANAIVLDAGTISPVLNLNGGTINFSTNSAGNNTFIYANPGSTVLGNATALKSDDDYPAFTTDGTDTLNTVSGSIYEVSLFTIEKLNEAPTGGTNYLQVGDEYIVKGDRVLGGSYSEIFAQYTEFAPSGSLLLSSELVIGEDITFYFLPIFSNENLESGPPPLEPAELAVVGYGIRVAANQTLSLIGCGGIVADATETFNLDSNAKLIIDGCIYLDFDFGTINHNLTVDMYDDGTFTGSATSVAGLVARDVVTAYYWDNSAGTSGANVEVEATGFTWQHSADFPDRWDDTAKVWTVVPVSG
ncbi:MAG: FecR domain-containing protein [Oscillospiraceae bacterium]|jgi:hypothetical protein|nr:FecR domain-containing protein [Oscillospiraceae bacterium]